MEIIEAIQTRLPEMPEVGGQTKESLFNAFKIALRSNPKIGTCTQQSVIASVEKFAALGLRHGEGHFIPYGKECTLIIDYTGLVSLMTRGGNVVSVDTQVVRQGDTFRSELGTDPKLIHVPDLSDPERSAKPLTHAYAVLRFRDGTQMIEVMDRAQIDRIKNASRGGRSGPWASHFDEMARKTVIRNIAKRAPKSDLLLDCIKHLNDTEPADFGLERRAERAALKAAVEQAESDSANSDPVIESRPVHKVADQKFLDSLGDDI